MGFIWSDYSEEKRFSLCTEHLVSGVEVWKAQGDDIKVNVLVRLKDLVFPPKIVKNDEIFSDIIDKYTNDTFYREIFNYIMHLQAVSDCNSGAGFSDIISINTENAIMNGDYGEDIRECYCNCSSIVRYVLLQCRSEYLISGGRKNMFEFFIEKVFSGVNIYYQQSTAKTYIYIHEDEDSQKLGIIRLGKYFLADMSRETEIMWKGEHLPFIGTDWSMVLGGIYLG